MLTPYFDKNSLLPALEVNIDLVDYILQATIMLNMDKPTFDSFGNLPTGIKWLQWTDIIKYFSSGNKRFEIVRGLKAALLELKQAGCHTVYIDGSFATKKARPRDFDGCWDPDGVDFNILDPVLLSYERGRLKQKAKYRGELFQVDQVADNNGTVFFDFFQTDKQTGQPKGIIGIDLRRLT